LHAEQSLLFRTVRDLLMRDIDRVFVNDTCCYDQLREIADVMAPKLKARILLRRAKRSLDRYETETKIEKALARKVWLKSGVCDYRPHEALTSIDVNSGKFVGKDNLEKTITAVNAKRQRRLQSSSGFGISAAHHYRLYRYGEGSQPRARAQHA
jgi:ribonuclease G